MDQIMEKEDNIFDYGYFNDGPFDYSYFNDSSLSYSPFNNDHFDYDHFDWDHSDYEQFDYSELDKDNVSKFALKSLETCPDPGTSKSSGNGHGNDRSKVPLYLVDLSNSGLNPDASSGQSECHVKVVKRETVPNLNTVQWATLSYARGSKAPRRLAVNGMDEFKSVLKLDQVPSSVLSHAIEIVKSLDIQYLWVDSLCSEWQPPCSEWEPDDNIEGRKNYVNIFEGAKINIVLPDYSYLKRIRFMDDVFDLYLRGEGGAPAGDIDANLFLGPFFADPWARLDCLLSPRKLFCLPNGNAVWAVADRCTHSLWGPLRVDQRDCLLRLPKFCSPEQQQQPLPPPSSSLPFTNRPQKKPSGHTAIQYSSSLKGANQTPKSTTNSQYRIHKSTRNPKRKDNMTSFSKAVTQVSLESGAAREATQTVPFSTMSETLSRCCNILCAEDRMIILQVMACAYGIANSVPAPWQWWDEIGHVPGDLLWYGDVLPLYDATSLVPWIYWDGPKVFLQSFWFFNKPPTSSARASGTRAEATRGGHPLNKNSIGKLDRGFNLSCAYFKDPSIKWAAYPEFRDQGADRVFGDLRTASVKRQPTFLGAGITADNPWNYDPPQMRNSMPCYIYDDKGGLMGRGIVDDPESLERVIWENESKLMLAFLMRESLELRGVELPLHWETEPESWRPRPYLAHVHNSCVVDSDVVALEVNYGLILLGNGNDYGRAGVFEVYGKGFASSKEKQIYVC